MKAQICLSEMIGTCTYNTGQHTRFWYLLHHRAMKAQMSLLICADLSDFTACIHKGMAVDEDLGQNVRVLAFLLPLTICQHEHLLEAFAHMR